MGFSVLKFCVNDTAVSLMSLIKTLIGISSRVGLVTFQSGYYGCGGWWVVWGGGGSVCIFKKLLVSPHDDKLDKML